MEIQLLDWPLLEYDHQFLMYTISEFEEFRKKKRYLKDWNAFYHYIYMHVF